MNSDSEKKTGMSAFIPAEYTSTPLQRMADRGGWFLSSHISPQLKKTISFATLVCFLAFTFFPQIVLAAPVIENIQGDGSLNQDVQGNITNITVAGNLMGTTTNADQLANEIWNIHFANPTDSLILNVFDASGTQLLGTINIHNGLFALLNSAGVEIAESAAINLFDAGFIASALGSINANLETGKYVFQSEDGKNGFVLNEGKITGTEGSFAALLGRAVENAGEIEMPMGKVALAGGEQVTLSLSGQNDFISVVVDEGVTSPVLKHGVEVQNQVEIGGTIEAHQVKVDAKAVNDVFDNSVNITGHVKATTAVENEDGSIDILATGAVNTMGVLEATLLREKAAAFNIGGIYRVGHSYHDNLDNAITFAADATVDGSEDGSGADGTLNDIVNIVINAGVTLTLGSNFTFNADSDGNGSGAFLMDSTATIQGQGYNLTINASDNSTIGIIQNVGTLEIARNAVDANIVFSSATTVDDIDVGTFYTNSSTATGVTFTKAVGDGITTPRLVYDVTQLQAMQDNLGWDYELANDIDASATANWIFSAIGSEANPFTGTLDGQGNVIGNLFMDDDTAEYLGLFGVTQNAEFTSIHLENVNITSLIAWATGGLAGWMDGGTAADVSVTGAVDGWSSVGGLVGYSSAAIQNSYTSGTVSKSGTGSSAGGLVGGNEGSVQNSFSSATVTASNGGWAYGGLVGFNGGTVSDSYATGNVSGNRGAGGLVGHNDAGSIERTYATGNVAVIVGEAGGLVGEVANNGSISDSYAIGTTSGGGSKGGLLGSEGIGGGTYTNNWWFSGAAAGIGNTTDAEVTKAGAASDFYGTGGGTGGAVYSGWDFTEGNSLWNSFSGTTPHQDYEWSSTITTLLQLQNMNLNLAGNYTLANDIDASATQFWNWDSGSSSYLGFDPVGDDVNSFSGTFDGNDFEISGLTIDRPSQNYVGLFGHFSGTDIMDVGLVGGNITGYWFVGSITGWNTSGTLDNVYSTGAVSGGDSAGGLVGINMGTISDSYNTGNVSGTEWSVGGLAGESWGVITSSHNAGNIFGADNPGTSGWVGGLVGTSGGSITNSYNTGAVFGYETVGGLVGNHAAGSIANTYSTGDVTASDDHVGGLVGDSVGGSISDSYATGNVVGVGYVGGLVGWNFSSDITNSYAAGLVNEGVEGLSIGGLLGEHNSGTLTNNYWNTETTGQSVSAGEGAGAVEGKTSAEMMDPNTFSGWDLSSSLGHDWAMQGTGEMFPMLQMRHSTSISDAYQLQLMFLDLDADYTLANDIDASETTTWNWDGVNYFGFDPIGNNGTAFTGTFDGQGNVISNLYINKSGIEYVGLFGVVDGATLSNVGLEGVTISADNYVGALTGYNYNGSLIQNSYSTGAVNGAGYIVGGLVGRNYASTIRNSYSTADVTGGVHSTGGLVGFSDTVSSFIINSYATGTVTGVDHVGGLVGQIWNNSSVTNSFATGTVSGSTNVGGLIGIYSNGTLTNNWWLKVTTPGQEHNATLNDIGDDGDVGVGDANIATESVLANFYEPTHAVYDIGGANEWNIFTPVWDVYSGVSLPHLHFENYGTADAVWSGNTSTAWNTPTNWAAGSAPIASSIAHIFDRVNDPTTSTAVTLANLNIYGGTTTLGNTLDLSGDMNLVGGTLDAAGFDMTVSGDWTNSGGTFTANGGTNYFAGSANIQSNGSHFNHVDFGNGNNYTLQDDVYIDGNWTNNGGTIDTSTYTTHFTGTTTLNDSTTTFNYFDVNGGTVDLASELHTDYLAIQNGGTLNANGHDIYDAGSWLNSGTFNSGGGTQTVYLSNAATIQSNSSHFNHVEFSGASNHILFDDMYVDGNWTNTGAAVNTNSYTTHFTGATTLNDSATTFSFVHVDGGTLDLAATLNTSYLQIENGSTLNANSYDIYDAGGWWNYGTFNSGGGAQKVYFNGFGNISGGASNFNAIEISGTSTLAEAMTVGDDLIIAGGGSLDAAGYGITIGGDWMNDGTFTHGNNAVTFNGGALQFIMSGNSHFYDVVFDNSSGSIQVAEENLDIENSAILNRYTAIETQDNRNLNFGTINSQSGESNGLDITAGIGAIDIGGAVGGVDTLGNFQILSSGSFTAHDSIAVGSDLDINSTGSIAVAAVTTGGSQIYTGAVSAVGDLTMGGDLTVNDTLDMNSNDLFIGGGWTNLISKISELDTVNLTGSGNINDAGTFNNLTINSSGTYTAVGNPLAVSGALNVQSGTLNANGQAATVTGLTTVSGGTYQTSTAKQTLNGGLTVSGTGTITAGTGEIEVNGNYSQTNGTFTGAAGVMDVNGDFAMTAGTFTAPSSQLTVSEDFLVSGGAFNHNSGDVILDGDVDITVQAGGTIDFWDFTITSLLTKTVSFTAGDTFNVLSPNTFTVTGADALNPITLQSTNTGGTRWNLGLEADGWDLTNVVLKDSNNTNFATTGYLLDGGTVLNLTDGGNNNNAFAVVIDDPPTCEELGNCVIVIPPTCPGPNCPDDDGGGDDDGDTGGGDDGITLQEKEERQSELIEIDLDSLNEKEEGDCDSVGDALTNPSCREGSKSKVTVYEGSVYLYCADGKEICGVMEAGGRVEIEGLAPPSAMQTIMPEEKEMGKKLYEEMKRKVSEAPRANINVPMVESRMEMPTQPRFATLTKMQGEVFVKKVGTEEWMPAQAGMVFAEKDEIKTGRGAKVEVHLDHDAETGKFYLYENSLLRLAALERDGVSQDKNTVLDLAMGRVITRAEKLEGESKFKIRTPTVVAGVRGTLFEISVDGVMKEVKEAL